VLAEDVGDAPAAADDDGTAPDEAAAGVDEDGEPAIGEPEAAPLRTGADVPELPLPHAATMLRTANAVVTARRGDRRTRLIARA
jgi:hypothetical protein